MGKIQTPAQMKTALVAGGTGLVGRQVVELLVKDPEYTKVICLARRTIPIQNPKIEFVETDGSNLQIVASHLTADDVFCCLGTTIKKAKTKEAFRKIDYDYPLALAWMTKSLGAKQFHLVSALGANEGSSVFYNRVKGETESAIRKVGFDSYHIYRPSLLLGARDEERSGEDAAKVFFKLFGFLVPSRYKAIDSAKVARAMVVNAARQPKGTHIHSPKKFSLSDDCSYSKSLTSDRGY